VPPCAREWGERQRQPPCRLGRVQHRSLIAFATARQRLRASIPIFLNRACSSCLRADLEVDVLRHGAREAVRPGDRDLAGHAGRQARDPHAQDTGPRIAVVCDPTPFCIPTVRCEGSAYSKPDVERFATANPGAPGAIVVISAGAYFSSPCTTKENVVALARSVGVALHEVAVELATPVR